MSKTLLYELFGLGRIPKKYAFSLRQEGIVLMDQGIRGSVTYRQFRAPGRRYSWKKSAFIGSLVLTRQTFAAFAMTRPLLLVPLEDKRLSELCCCAEKENTLVVAYDASLFSTKASGTVECRFRTEKARLYLERLAPDST
jgi:hypothetical protein